MSLFLLRDDDANATTDPRLLEQAYAPLLDAGHRLVFSVIPSVALDTRAPDGAPERFLGADAAGPARRLDLRPDSPLAAWLRTHRDRCDVAQHGLDHSRVRGDTEFGSLSYHEAGERLDAGRRLLTAALGRPPAGFVAPWDVLSRGSLVAAVERFPVISTSWVDRERLARAWWPAHALERLSRSETLWLGRARVLRHRGGLLGPATAPAEVPAILERLAHGAAVTVVVLHHWMFPASDGPHPVITALARALAGRRTVDLDEIAPRASRSGTALFPRQDRARPPGARPPAP